VETVFERSPGVADLRLRTQRNGNKSDTDIVTAMAKTEKERGEWRMERGNLKVKHKELITTRTQ